MIARDKLKVLIKTVLFCISIFVFLFYLKIALDNLRGIQLDSSILVPIFLSFLIMMIGVLSSSLVFVVLTPGIGVSKGIFCSYYSQIGKYLPGNFAQHLGKFYLASRYDISKKSIGISIALELGISIFVAIIISIFSLILSPELYDSLSGYLVNYAFYIKNEKIIIVFTVFLSIFLVFLFIKVKAGRHSDYLIRIFAALILLTLNFILYGVVINILITQVFNMEGANLLHLVSLFSIAWLAGFVLPGAPGGLGIREFIITILFSPIISYENSVFLGIIMRILSISSDLTSFWLACFIPSIKMRLI